ncbi:hypothetical protein HY489_01990 [Candidatus Woesearchaeota archaeon]|nr:hypothetical protein [Candidatus Woesearchaeota archaeon]
MTSVLEQTKIPLPIVNLRVYHATLSGEKMEVIKSFKQVGARPDLAAGYGQGAAFYVFTRLSDASNHTKNILADAIEKKMPVKGIPVIIVIDASINPKEWDMDYEMNLKIAGQFIFDNFNNMVKKIGDGDVRIDDRYVKFSDPETRIVQTGVIKLALSNEPGGSRVAQATIRVYESQGVIMPARVGPIFNKLQQMFPKETYQLEKKLFEQLASKRGIIIKYVGKIPLRIAGYYVFYKGDWIPGSDFELIPEMKALLQE